MTDAEWRTRWETMMEVAFSLGSNLGDRLAYLVQAKERILQCPGTVPAAQSPVYETEPVGVRPEYADLKFLNAVLVVESDRSPESWREELAVIEDALGRIRGEDRYAPRSVDVDLLYAGGARIDDGGLVVPHPRWAERRFVVQPLADVRPQQVLPGSRHTVLEVLERLPEKPGLRRYTETW